MKKRQEGVWGGGGAPMFQFIEIAHRRRPAAKAKIVWLSKPTLIQSLWTSYASNAQRNAVLEYRMRRPIVGLVESFAAFQAPTQSQQSSIGCGKADLYCLANGSLS